MTIIFSELIMLIVGCFIQLYFILRYILKMYLCYTFFMKLYESSEDYLETVLILKERNGNVHAIDIAREMGFSKPSVSIAIHKLEDNGYLTITEDGNILLTESGAEIANKIYDRHLTISKALTMLGVNEEQSLVDACKIEHDISEETFAKLKEFVKKHEQ